MKRTLKNRNIIRNLIKSENLQMLKMENPDIET